MLQRVPLHPVRADEPLAFEAEGVGYAVDGRALLASIDVSFPPGHVSALVGHNGSGKSTLLKLLAGQLRADVGEIRLGGHALDAWRRRDFARRVGYLPQQTANTGGMTVRELVAHGRYPWHGALGRFGDTDREKVDEAMRLTRVDTFADRQVDTLSGGERQRAWLAMLVAQDSRILLLDEPISALDIAHQVEVLSLIRDLGRQRKASTVIVLHDINMAARYADRIIALHDIISESDDLAADVLGAPDAAAAAAAMDAFFQDIVKTQGLTRNDAQGACRPDKYPKIWGTYYRAEVRNPIPGEYLTCFLGDPAQLVWTEKKDLVAGILLSTKVTTNDELDQLYQWWNTEVLSDMPQN